MKNNILAKSFLLLALIITLSTQAYASEVTGNLSSSGVASEQTSGSSGGSNGTTDNGTIAGNVESASGSSSSSGNTSNNNTQGSVLGESTTVSKSPSPANSTTNRTTTIAQASSNDTSSYNGEIDERLDFGGDVLAAETAEADTSTQVAAIADGADGIGMSSWFWIILISLLMVGLLVYFTRRQTEKSKSRLE